MNIVIFGAPGSGKGTQSEKLINEYSLHHISTGDVLREHIANGTEIGKVASAIIANGQLIPDNLMIDILADNLKNHPDALEKGVIFDGFPRTIPQAEALNELLKKEYDSEIHAVVGLEVAEDELVRRMIERGKSSGRADDNLETIQKRLSVYHKQTQPLCDTLLRNRYKEWMKKLGYPKFADPRHKSINFQLFPPRNGTDDNYARHGNGRENGFPKLNIPLENTEGATLIFRADIVDDIPVISVF